MNNIHDMGGMHGFGAIPIEEDEPVFHTDWEAKAMALTVAMGAWGKWNIDASRFQRESLGPLEYLQFTYYERWLAGLADLMVALPGSVRSSVFVFFVGDSQMCIVIFAFGRCYCLGSFILQDLFQVSQYFLSRDKI